MQSKAQPTRKIIHPGMEKAVVIKSTIFFPMLPRLPEGYLPNTWPAIRKGTLEMLNIKVQTTP